MRTMNLITFLMLVVLLSNCIGIFFNDLDYERDIFLEAPFTDERFRCEFIAGNISICGVPYNNASFSITIREDAPDDVIVRLSNGSLVFESRSGNDFYIARLYARLPFQTSLQLRCVSGNITIKGIDTREVVIKATSGDITLEDITCELLCIKTASGEITLLNCDIDTVKLDGIFTQLSFKNTSYRRIEYD